MSGYQVGFVYVLVDKGTPGLVKIGRTQRLAEDRAKELRTTVVPYQFQIAFRALTSEPEGVERTAHRALEAHRVARDREFFEVGPQVAIDVVRQALIDVAGIESCGVLAPVGIDTGDRMALTLRAGQVFLLLEGMTTCPGWSESGDSGHFNFGREGEGQERLGPEHGLER